MRAHKPANESERLTALRRYRLLDTDREASFDRITELVARVLEVPIALITLVDADRVWLKSCLGLQATETNRDDSFCAHAVLGHTPSIVSDATKDPRFADNPSVLGPPHVRFYAGVPIQTPDGYNLGTLCAVDVRPRQLTEEQIATLSGLAKVVGDLVEARLAYHARHMMQQIADLSPDVIYVFDLCARANVYANREVTSVLGYAPEAESGSLLPRMLHPDDLAVVQDHFRVFETLRDGEKTEIVYRVKAATGEHRWFRANETVFARNGVGKPTQILGIATDITSLKDSERRLSDLAVTDDLTGLPNKRAIRERLTQLVREGCRGRRFALVMADIDHFKQINDAHGHKLGDEVVAAHAG